MVEFRLRGAPPRRTTYWLVVDEVLDLCLVDSGQEVDLCVRADLRGLTQVWMGDRTWTEATSTGLVEVLGPPALSRRFGEWFGHHPVLGAVPRADAG